MTERPIADGGRPEDVSEDDRTGDDRPTEGRGDDPDGRMRDVSHTPTAGEGANRVWDGTRVHERDDDE